MAQRSQRLTDLAISESGFVFDPRTGDVFTVNSTGRAILLLLKDGKEAKEIAGLLPEMFDSDDADVSRDVNEFISVLGEFGLAPEESEAS